MTAGHPIPALLILLILPLYEANAQDPRDFFESRIRPVLAEHCYRCHNSSGDRKGGLALDHREPLRRGGDSGPAIVVGHGNDSLLVRAVRHTDDGLRMPAKGPKLERAVISDLVKWIDDGAVDPRDAPPTAGELRDSLSWDEVRRRRMAWWCWQPIHDPAVPEARNRWSDHAIDRFVRARLEAAGLDPASRADTGTLIRRATFVLTGLPPTPEEIDMFLGDASPDAYDRLVDRLLASPRFGERWARHWMDWFRYADSHGSEGDPAIPYAWRYRDYLIRALNADVPFDQLVKEHIAGDLLPKPRINNELGINESLLGTAQYRFVQHGFAPTDALEEQVRFTDNQIDVLSKAFLGLTVSCARCHDHKFDAIGQSDFYALYGILASCRPALVAIDTPDRLEKNRRPMGVLKGRMKPALARAWLATVDRLPERLSGTGEPLTKLLEAAAKDNKSPLHAWARITKAGPDSFVRTWTALADAWKQSLERLEKQRTRDQRGWDLSGDAYQEWFRYGVGLGADPTPAGGFHVLPDGDRVVSAILPAGVFTHLASSKHNGILSSPRFRFDMRSIHVRVMGDGGAKARYVVQNYPRGGTVYPSHGLQGGNARWVRWDMRYWRGDHGYLELSTAADHPVEHNANATRSWFGITDAVLISDEQAARNEIPRDEQAEFVSPLFEVASGQTLTSRDGLATVYVIALRACITSWAAGELTDQQANFLSYFVSNDLLPTRLSELPEVAPLVREYRALEEQVPVPTRAPGILEAEPFDQPLFVRGDHKKPGDPVPRRFLEAIDDEPYGSDHSGRLELAADMVRPDNPLTPRVAVNRLWHHVFGRGIVATTDNFGRLGEKPTHPDLLDYLAHRFTSSGWSIKKLIRLLVTSETFRAGHQVSARAARIDPSNRLLSHARVRRLEAEAVRDALLAVTGRLQDDMYGPPVAGNSTRRSVYVRVKRNDLDPLLSVFDAPEPHTTRGRRDTTNVPTQSLTLLNDPFVFAQAGAWSGAVLRDKSLKNDRQRFRRMFLDAFGRHPSEDELRQSAALIDSMDANADRLTKETAGLEARIATARARVASIIEPVREHLRAQTKRERGEAPPGPVPIARWKFDDNLEDAIGVLHGKSRGTARIEDGALVLDGDGHVETAPLARDLLAKTLEAWVQLNGLGQRGGGVVSVESIGGGRFDSIVFGERDPRQWLPGSNFFKRTQALNGPAEAEAGQRPVHVAITYAPDGTITTYRDGKPYGRAYKSDGPERFAAGECIVVFGLRHSPADGRKRLRGRILQASVYDRALTPDEILASATGDRRFVSQARVLAALSDTQRREYARGQADIAEAVAARARLDVPDGYRLSRDQLWRGYAQSLINLKEFIYVR